MHIRLRGETWLFECPAYLGGEVVKIDPLAKLIRVKFHADPCEMARLTALAVARASSLFDAACPLSRSSPQARRRQVRLVGLVD